MSLAAPIETALLVLKERKSPEARRHKLEYDTKYESSPDRVKYREDLNRERRRRGIYGSHNHKDVSHTQGGGLTLENEHSNRARHFKNQGTLRPIEKAWSLLKRDKKDMQVGKVYPSDRAGKKIMMRTHEDKKIHAGAKGYGNYKGKGKNRGGGTHTDEGRRDNFKARHNCDQCKGKITTPKCLACEKLW
tara:strand:- start:86 stop:655 length:570 start_codon:yes stop_codon:yes gene_type:complete